MSNLNSFLELMIAAAFLTKAPLYIQLCHLLISPNKGFSISWPTVIHQKSPRPDSVHPLVLKTPAAEISPMLTHIFKQSLQTGTIPSQWKHAYVSPIFKKGQKSDPKNYRPISLTSIICKSMEHIIVSQIMKHLEDQNILIDRQFGFRSKHSCELQLYVTINDIAKQIDSNLHVDAAILDFSNAFDKVPTWTIVE